MDWNEVVLRDYNNCEGCGRVTQKREISKNGENSFFWICDCGAFKKVYVCSVEYMQALRGKLK